MSNRLSPRDAERPMARCPNCNGYHPVRFVNVAWELKDHTSFTWEGGTKPCAGSERTVTVEAILAVNREALPSGVKTTLRQGMELKIP